MTNKLTLTLLILSLVATHTNSSAAKDTVITTVATSTKTATKERITTMLLSAGITSPIISIEPSPITGLVVVKTLGFDPLIISEDLSFVILGQIVANTSPIRTFDPAIAIHLPVGMPVTATHKQALLDNMANLRHISMHSAFYHTAVDGLLWGVSAHEHKPPFMVTSDGRYFITGEMSMIQDGQLVGLDMDFEHIKNRDVLSRLDERTLTIYPAQNEKTSIYIATDINCPYCKILHRQIPKLNAQGITVKAIGYPIYDESVEPMRQIWCEQNNTKRAALLATSMSGITPKKQCSTTDNRLSTNQTIAHGLAIVATPAIYSVDGRLYEEENFDGIATFAGVR